jgi:hypothetical protein
MSKAIAGAIGVSVALLGIGLVGMFITMVILNGFSERTGVRIMMVLAAVFFAVHFLVTSRVAKALLPDGKKAKGRTIGAVVTAIPAVAAFGTLLTF